MTLVITGASGALGGYLARQTGGVSSVVGTCFSQSRPGLEAVDLTDPVQTRRFLDRHQPNHVIHTVALTDVDRSQADPAAAYRLTVSTTDHIASWIREGSPGTRLTYVSTDHVYDGPGPHVEDHVCPVNVYALTKLWAETLAREVPIHLVLRLNFFGPARGGRRTFTDWLLDELRASQPIRLFHDVYFSPLYAAHAAAVIAECDAKDIRGTFNLGASGAGISKADFGQLLADAFGLSLAQATRASIKDAALTANRPLDMRLSVARLEARLGHRLPTIREGVALMRAHMMEGDT